MGQYHWCPCIRVAADLGAVISCFLINCLLSHPSEEALGGGGASFLLKLCWADPVRVPTAPPQACVPSSPGARNATSSP